MIEEAAVAPERQRFSHSRLSTLDDCPRRYQFRYVDRLKEAFQTIEAFMGTMVHEALQWAYLEREGLGLYFEVTIDHATGTARSVVIEFD